MSTVSRFQGLALVAAALAFATAAHAETACKLQIEPAPSAWIITGYDALAGGAATGEFDVAFSNTGDLKCEGSVVLRLDGEPWGLKGAQGGRLPYTVIDKYNGSDVTPTSSVGARRSQLNPTLQIDPGQRKLLRYSMVVNTDNLPSDGIFQQTVFLDFQSTDGLSIGEHPISLGLNVAPSSVMGLKGAFARNDKGARIDLGELSTGATNLPVDLYVLSTRAYIIGIQSEHNGRLKLSQGDWYVPYSLTLGGHTIDLAAGGGQLKAASGPSFHDDSYPLGIVVGNVSNSRAGAYADVLTLTVSPL